METAKSPSQPPIAAKTSEGRLSRIVRQSACRGHGSLLLIRGVYFWRMTRDVFFHKFFFANLPLLPFNNRGEEPGRPQSPIPK
mmetsp:Transcript_8184/g.18384  ORF Transcript_8184/g.18384 Transcript_8184/m.18384 type:complete len:83 (-) Transcript_8184:100-348(-)